MKNNITIAFIRRRFENLVCPAMGWKCGPAYSIKPGATTATPNHGNVWIEKAPNNSARWRVAQMCKGSSGERNLCDNFNKAEFMAWMDGILRASDAFNESEATLKRAVSDFVLDHRNGLEPDVSRLSLALGSPKQSDEG